MLLHEFEQARRTPLLVVQPMRARFHRRASGIGLHAAQAPARAASAPELDDHVTDLSAPSPPRPGLAVEHHPPAHARPPEDPQKRSVGTTRAELELGAGCYLHAVSVPDLRSQ